MKKINNSRRRFLKGAVAAGALAGTGRLMPLSRSFAQSTGGKRGFFFIHLFGGMDTLYHLVPEALPNLVNREVDPLLVTTTSSGVRYYDPLWYDMRDHMEDCVSIRNIACATGHFAGDGEMYYGSRDAAEMAAAEAPWFNYASSELLANQYAVAPSLLTYVARGDSGITRYFNSSNRSPDPSAAAQRVTEIQTFADSLDALAGLPDASYQSKLFKSQGEMNSRVFSDKTQRDFLDRFSGAFQQSNGLIENPTPSIWPPSETLRSQFGLTDEGLNEPFVRVAPTDQQIALAFECARLRLANCFYLESLNNFDYDSHFNNVERQSAASGRVMPPIAKLLTALKTTPSPYDASRTMFEDYSVVVFSEIGRANAPDPSGGGLSGGTPHWGWTSAACFGGGFKRGYKFGEISAGARGVPANLETGALNEGRVVKPGDLAATLLAATGLPPKDYGEPIAAVLS